jgi:hypothetical protein
VTADRVVATALAVTAVECVGDAFTAAADPAREALKWLQSKERQ